MVLFDWLAPMRAWFNLRRRYPQRKQLVYRRRRRQIAVAPQVDALEDRCMLSSMVVTSTADLTDFNPGDGIPSASDGTVTLRAAIQEANALGGSHTVSLLPGTYTLQISGSDSVDASAGDLDVTADITINVIGGGVATIDAGGDAGIGDRVFDVNGGTLTLDGVIVRGGRESGGGVRNVNGTVNLIQSTFTDNTNGVSSGPGGGILNDGGTLNILSSTISGNATTSSAGGGIANINSGVLDVVSSTIANNSADTGGGIATTSGASSQLRNTIVSGNTAATGPDVAEDIGTFTSAGHNLIGDVGSVTAFSNTGDQTGVDPLLDPLGNYGGATPTHALSTGSPAIDAGDDSVSESGDQRGYLRSVDGDGNLTAQVDIGAFEFGSTNAVSEIRGVKFADVDGDGTYSPGTDTLLSGVTVFLDQNQNGLLDGQYILEPDDHGQGSSLAGADPFVGLSAVGTQVPFGSPIEAVFQPSLASTGQLVFGIQGDAFWFDDGTGNHRSLQIDFGGPVASVSLDVNSQDNGRGRLEVYDEFGRLLASTESSALTGTPETLTLSRTERDISYAVLRCLDTLTTVTADHLVYDIGEVSTVTDVNGEYVFTGLRPGEYHVAELAQETATQTAPAPPSDRLFLLALDGSGDIVEIDPQTTAEVGRFAAPEGFGGSEGLAFDGTNLYYLTSTSHLYVLNPDNGNVLLDVTITQGSGNFEGLAAVGGKLYFADGGNQGILEFDPAIGAVTNVLDVDQLNQSIGLSFSGGLAGISSPNALLLTDNAQQKVFELSPFTGVVTGSFSIQNGGNPIGGLGVIDGAVFVGRQSENRVDVYSRSGDLLRSFALPWFGGASGLSGDDVQRLGGRHTVTLGLAEIVANLDFGNAPHSGVIRGTKWEDTDGDGVFDVGVEQGLAGVTIYLDLNQNGQLDQQRVLDPDNYQQGADLTVVDPLATLTAVGNAATGDTVQAVESGGVASTGTRVFGVQGDPSWFDDGAGNSRSLRGDFSGTVASVSIDVIGENFARGRLEVYDSNGQLLAAVNSAQLQFNQSETLSLSRAAKDISYAIVRAADANLPIAADNLQYDVGELSTVTAGDGTYEFIGLPPGTFTVAEIGDDSTTQTFPAPAQDRLFAFALDGSGDIVELNSQTGAEVNRFSSPTGGFGSEGLAYDGETLYFLSASNQLYELDPATGQTKVIREVKGGSGNFDGLATVGGLVYIVDAQSSNIVVFSPQLNSVIDVLDVDMVNQSQSVNIAGGAAGISGPNSLLVADSSQQRIHELSLTTGELIQSIDLQGSNQISGIAVIGGQILVGTQFDQQLQVYSRSGDLLRTMVLPFANGVGGLSGDDIASLGGRHVVTVGVTEIVEQINFGNTPHSGVIQGVKWSDLNADGVFDQGTEPGLEGVTIFLDHNQNGLLDQQRTIEPDDYPPNSDLTGVDPLVTLSVVGAYANGLRVESADAFGLASTGTLAFSAQGDPFWFTDSVGDRRQLRIDFSDPVASLSIDVASDSNHTARLEVYNRSGQLVGVAESNPLASGFPETLTLSRAGRDIAYAIVGSTGLNSSIVADNLVYDVGEISTATDPGGFYQFTGLAPGNYVVAEINDGSFVQTFPVPATDRLFMTTSDGSNQIVEVDPNTGAELQRLFAPEGFSGGNEGLAFDGYRLYFIGSSNVLYELDPDTGGVLQSYSLQAGSGSFDGLAAVGGKLYIVDVNVGDIFVFDPAVGSITGVLDVDTVNQSEGLSLAGGLAGSSGPNTLILADQSQSRLVHLSTSTGRIIDSIPLQNSPGNISGVAVINGLIFVGSQSSNVIDVYSSSGQFLRSVNVPNGVNVGSLAGDDAALLGGRHAVTVGVAQTVDFINFGNVPHSGIIQGIKWSDLDGDGVYDDQVEPGFPGVTIFLDQNGNRVLDGVRSLDPDSFTVGASLATVDTLARLSAVGSFGNQNPVESYEDPGLATTGTRVFAHENDPYWFLDSSGNSKDLRIDFLGTVASVNVDVYGQGGERGRLEVYDANGNLLASTDSSLLNNQSETLSITRSLRDIAYAIVRARDANTAITIDNLVYDVGELSTVTASDGTYAFTGLAPGDYVVVEVPDPSYQQTFPLPPSDRLFAVVRDGSNSIAELDPATGNVLNQFAFPQGFENGAEGLAFDGESLFFLGDTNRLFELNPDTGSVIGFTDLPASSDYDGMAYVGGRLYIADQFNNDIIEYDPAFGTVTNVLDVDNINAVGLSVTGGLAGIAGPNAILLTDHNQRLIYEIDPQTGLINGSFAMPGSPGTDNYAGLAVIDGEIHLGHLDQNIIEVYSRTGTFLRTITTSLGVGVSALSGDDVGQQPGVHRVTVGLAQLVDQINFGNFPLNVPPNPSIDSISTPRQEGTQISVIGSATDTEDDDATLLYAWEAYRVGEGTPFATLSGINETQFDFTPDNDGDVRIDLTVTDSNLASTTVSQTITVVNVEPVIGLSAAESLDEGDTLAISGTYSDPVDTLTATVDYGEGAGPQPLALNPNGTFDLNHLYADDGVFTLTVAISDDDATTTAITTVTVANVAPIVTVPATATVAEGTELTIGGTFSDPGGIDQGFLTGTVNYGDGSPGEVLTLNPDGSFDLAHTYVNNGNFTITVSVSDEDETTNETIAVNVTNVAPIVTMPGNATINEGSLFAAQGTFDDPGADDLLFLTATVDYGDGGGAQPLTLNPAGTFDLSHTYANDGVFTVTVSVTDDVDTTVETTTVTVNNVAPAITLPASGAADEGSPFSDSGSVSDPGADTLTATVDYGEGAGPQLLTLNPDGTFDLSHTYADNGVYTVTVSVSDDDTTSNESFDVTVANVAPTVVVPTSGTSNEGSLFTDSGSFSDPGINDTFAATVDYGDGTGVQVLILNPNKTFDLSHSYADNGVFTVTVTVDDSDGPVIKDFDVTVANVAPIVVLPASGSANEGGPFTDSGSFSDVGVNDVHTATVDYGDGTGVQPLTLNPDDTFGLAHTFANDGVFTVTVTVNDGDDSTVETFDVTVANVAPTLVVPSPQSANEGTEMTASGSTSDPGDDTLTAAVDYGDGSGAQALAINPDGTYDLSHTFINNGVFTVTVSLSDDDTTVDDTFSVTVANVAPIVTMPGAATISEGSLFTAQGTFDDPGADDLLFLTATVDYGDGGGAQSLTLNPAGTFDLSHTYANDGVFTVTVSVTDDVDTTVETTTVTVNNVAPAITLPASGAADEGSPFSDSGSVSDPGADALTATVDYGDGAGPQSLALNPDGSFDLNHTYAASGVYTVTVSVSDDDTTSNESFDVTVANLPPVITQLNAPSSVFEDVETAQFSATANDPGNDTFILIWDFGDGSPTAFGSSVTHVYQTPGDYTVTLTARDAELAESTQTASVSVLELGAVSGLMFDDADRDGLQGAGESPIVGATVRLIKANGVDVLDTETTDANGEYSFTQLIPGSYFVEFVPTNPLQIFTAKDANANANDDIDSDATRTTGRTDAISVVSGATTGNVDAGLIIPNLSIESVSEVEGDPGSMTQVEFTVSVDVPATIPVGGDIIVNFATNSGTATSGVDFESAAGTLTFLSGETEKTILVTLLGDADDEGNESFTLDLSSASGALIGVAQGTGTIIDDDSATVTLEILDASLVEGEAGQQTELEFVVRLLGQNTNVVTVDFATANDTATAGSDYVATTGTLTFQPGERAVGQSRGHGRCEH